MTYFRPGDVFGVQPVLTGDGYAFTVVATTRVELVGVSAAAVTAMLAAYPGANAGLLDRSPDTGPAASATRTGAAATRMDLSLTGLIDRGVLQGREVLVIDQTICTDCDNCVDACGRRHGQSRLARRGIQLGHLLFPAACRHCADPVCLLCSVDGIVRLPDGEITIVAENCIGCGACADRCPYDNIQMHARVPPPVGGPVRRLFFDLLDLARGGRARETALDQLDPTLARVAVKCDLCAGYADYACVTACPVGAAFRVDPSTAFGRNWTDEGLGIALERRR